MSRGSLFIRSGRAELLVASPGAPLPVHIITQVIPSGLPHLLAATPRRARMQGIIPRFGIDLRPTDQAVRYAGLTAPSRTTLRLA